MEKDLNKTKSTFCSAPYIASYIGMQGEFMPCCLFDWKSRLSTYSGDDNLLDHMNSTAAVQLRKDLHNGVRAKPCGHCWELEDKGLDSLRDNFNRLYDYDEIVKATNANNFFIPDLKLRYIDIRFSNKCNLKCVTCGSIWSTSWYGDSVKLGDSLPSEPKLKSIENTDNLLSQIYDQIDNIEQIYFAGGEPLMIPEHYKLLNKIIDKGRADKVKLLYSTNMAKLTYGKWDVVPLWKQFKEVCVQASLDGSHSRGEYLRTNIKWVNVEANIERLQKEVPHLNFNISPTVSWMNSYNVVDLYREFIEKKYLVVGRIHTNILHGPEQYTLWKLPKEHLDALVSKYSKHIEWIKTLDAPDHLIIKDIIAFEKVIIYIKEGLELKLDNHKEETYSLIHANLDKLRKVDFFNIFPEFADLKNKNYHE
jgi:organic radical activating enzyme|tara:strand:+ start:608 stop:1870 length:1263 start_codon:yes stop_codon:yes gene_type:complete